GFTFRFIHLRYQWCMGRLGTVLDTRLEESVPRSSFGSFIYRGFQPFVRHRVAPKTGKLYSLGTDANLNPMEISCFDKWHTCIYH
ncbi:hypothetical protein ACWATR_34810, partial [Nostoc sp. UIC 10890]